MMPDWGDPDLDFHNTNAFGSDSEGSFKEQRLLEDGEAEKPV